MLHPVVAPVLAIDVQAGITRDVFGLTGADVVALGVIALAVVLLAVALASLETMRRVNLRPVPGYERLRNVVSEAAETGETLHLSSGAGSAGGGTTAETLAGLSALTILMGRAATSRVGALLTTGSPIVLPILQAIAERSYDEAGAAHEHDAAHVRFAGDDRNAYAVAVADALDHEHVGASLLLGSLSDEALYIGERGRAAGVTQVIGVANPRALPYALVTADHLLIGEEMYAAGAYLSGQPAHVASLLVQDWLRVLIVGAIIVGVVLRTVGAI
jgi:hypothetical protein